MDKVVVMIGLGQLGRVIAGGLLRGGQTPVLAVGRASVNACWLARLCLAPPL